MKPRIDETPVSKEALKHYSLVFDAVYTPKLTRLLREAQESGATIVYGTQMFINQAFVQFEMFTGLPGCYNVSVERSKPWKRIHVVKGCEALVLGQ
ncbi:hypothetical protein QUC31_012110, partial [Theobroma cacao]